MQNNRRALLNAMNEADSFESDFFESDFADAPLIAPVSGAVGAEVAAIKGNPRFKAQFDISVDVVYYDRTGAAVVAPAALPAALQTQLAFPVFGNSDFDGGYKLFRERYPVGTGAAGTWAFDSDGIYARDATPTATGIIEYQAGDYFQKYTATVAANDYEAWLRIRCRQVAYGTLLGAISSDRFVINNIRYLIADSTKVAQYDNQIGLLRQSLFGKVSNDFVSPASMKRPEQFQVNIVDVPIRKGIDKETLLGSYLDFDATSITWSIFVMAVNKVQEKL
jgi:hypothetical protein